MKGVFQCICGKPIRQKKIIVIHPTNKNKFTYVCSEACARKLIVDYNMKDNSIDYSTIKIFVNSNSKRDVLNSMSLKGELNKRRNKKKKKKIDDEDVSDFKIDFGLNPESYMKKLIDSGKRIFKKELRENNNGKNNR